LNKSCYCVWDLQSTDRDSALTELLASVPNIGAHSREMLIKALHIREQAGATLVTPGIAMPHCRSILMDDLVIAIGRSSSGIPWPDEPAGVVVMFISPVKPSGPQEHMDLIAHLASHMKNNGPERITGASSPEKLAELLGLDLIQGG